MLLMLVAFFACGPDVSVSKVAVDADQDGYDREVDCDDALKSVHPEAPELCDELDNDCDGEIDEAPTDGTPFYADTDGDSYGDAAASVVGCADPVGFVADSTDCDDAEAAVNPAAVELCNGVDDDCDGPVDEDALDTITGFADADADGYGDPATGTAACALPADYVADNTDCDDTDAAVNPAATEVCNAVDDECDGLVDEDDDSLAGASTWYQDADSDTYGDAATTVTQCNAPSGYVADTTDCDDGDAAVNPGATEVCNTADDDCDTLVDDADASVDASGFTTWYRDADSDTYGDPSASVRACEAAGYVADDTDCDDADAGVNPGATEVDDNGVDEDCDGYDPPFSGWSTAEVSLSGADAWVGGANADERAGYTLAVADLDADGLGDVIAGVRHGVSAGVETGGAYVFYGGSLTGDHDLTDADVALAGEADGDAAGTQLAALGDLDGDGEADLMVGAHWHDSAGSGDGNVYVVTAATHDTLGDLGDAPIVITGETAGDYFGYYNSGAGDVDGDGLADLLVGASFRDESGSNAGKAYVFLADTLAGSGHFGAASADYSILGLAAGDYLGEDCSPAGDVDEDGLDDFMVGASQIDDGGTTTTGNGSVYLFLGGGLGSTAALDPAAADAVFHGAASGDAFGQALGRGDFDGDDATDLVVTAYHNDDNGSNAGAAYVFFAADIPALGAVDAADASVVVYGDAADDELGARTILGVDVDLDGADDLFGGALTADPNGTSSGVAFLFYASSLTPGASYSWADADTRFIGETAGDFAGGGLAAGDTDGDTVPDLVIGAYRSDATLSDAGGFHLMLTP